MYTNKEIIAMAKENSCMVYAGKNCGYDTYKLQNWDKKRNAWIESSSVYFYSQAKSKLKELYIENVSEIVYDDCNAGDAYRVYDYVDWRQYARIVINKARQNSHGIFNDIDLCDIMCN